MTEWITVQTLPTLAICNFLEFNQYYTFLPFDTWILLGNRCPLQLSFLMLGCFYCLNSALTHPVFLPALLDFLIALQFAIELFNLDVFSLFCSIEPLFPHLLPDFMLIYIFQTSFYFLNLFMSQYTSLTLLYS
jgi:hypothetical protein